jgi:hypothetical protein
VNAPSQPAWHDKTVPRPRLHLIHLHCVLVPNAKQRALVLPQAPEAPAQAAPPAERNACQSLCDIRGRQSGVGATGSLVGVFSSGGGLIQAAVGIGGSTGRLFLNRAGRPG